VASLYVFPKLPRDFRFPLTPFVAGASSSTSITSTGPIRMEIPGFRLPFDGCCLSMALSRLLGMVAADFAEVSVVSENVRAEKAADGGRND
jgi:hypothetical protein